MNNPEHPIAPVCRRCGTCCRNGGPTLHLEDRFLVERGILPLKDLVTLRKGEKVRDNVKGMLIDLADEIIKIKGRDHSWTCFYLDATHDACTIYPDRPLECRILNCRDTSRLEAVYARNRLKREDLLANVEGLWDLVLDHEARCSYQQVIQWVHKAQCGGWPEVKTPFVRMVAYDAQIRRLIADKGMAGAVDKLDFLFGRPLSRTLPAFGLQVRQQAGDIVITPQG